MKVKTMKKIELSEKELYYLLGLLNEKISNYNDGLNHDVDGKPYYFMPDGSISYDCFELDDLTVAEKILEKL